MKSTFSEGASDTRGAQADDSSRLDPQGGQDRPHRRTRLLAFLAWRSFGVRFALSRAKRRAHGHVHGRPHGRGSGPVRCMAMF